MKTEIKNRIETLREVMQDKKIDYYIVPTSDFHNSEYVHEYFKVREYLSGFTGSNGTLLLTKDNALLWTDGRYFIQAKKELEGTDISLMRMNEPGVLSLKEYIGKELGEKECLAFDGRVFHCSLGKELKQIADEKKAEVYMEEDLAAYVWKERPGLPCEKVFVLEPGVAGKTVSFKIEAVREKMKEKGAGIHILSKLDDIMWLFNIRGKDIPCNPVALSYAVLTETEVFLFLQENAADAGVKTYLKENGIELKSYDNFYEDIGFLLKNAVSHDAGSRILLDEKEVNYSLYRLAADNLEIVNDVNPTTLMKACKDETELSNMRKVYLEDSAAVVKFIYHMKKQMKEKTVRWTEKNAADYMDGLRKEIDGFLDLSFETISAYKENAAMMHYEATEESAKELMAEGLLLVDSGGQYLGGTTDVTRTIALGSLTEEEKRDFTLVAAGMLRLSNTKFLYGCTGRNLDIIARAPLWEIGKDYKCGTGHGIGYILNVHEGPQRISSAYFQGMTETPFEEGMVVTNEPGVYVENSHGIRTENVMVCKKAEKTSDGQFMCFETLTFVPIDLDAINPKLLSVGDKKLLNKYHAEVFAKISPFLNEEECKWLRNATQKID